MNGPKVKPRGLRRVVQEVSDRLESIAFIDRAQAEATREEREAAWVTFYGACPNDMSCLVKTVKSLVDWIDTAAAVATQIRDNRGWASDMEREAAITELADFLEARALDLSSPTGEEVDR
mgnify:CR=1 FL=1